MAERPGARRTAAPRPRSPVEPVHWGARLVRAPGVVYSEVAGTPVLVRVDDAELQPLPPAWAGCWAALDGGPIAEALGIDPSGIDPITSRNLIEVLRRLKAKRLVADVGSLGPDDRARALADDPTDQPASGPTDLTLHGRLEHHEHGTTLTIAAPPGFGPPRDGGAPPDDVPPDDAVTVHLTDVDGSLAATVAGAPVHVVCAGTSASAARPPTGQRGSSSDSLPAPEDVAGPTGAEAERRVLALAGLLAALDDPERLAEPGLVDVLAALAEHTHTTP